MGQQVMADRHRLRALQVCVSRHEPGGVRNRLGGEHIDQLRKAGDGLIRGVAAVEPQVECHLVVARPAGVQCSPGGGDLDEPPLDRGVDVFVRGLKLEIAVVELPLDPSQSPLDRGELRPGKEARGLEPPRVRDAPGDVVRIELVVSFERRRKALELGQQPASESPAPELSGELRYLVSLFASPSSRPKSRAWSWPCTRAEVRKPMPQSLMNPAAADWSNSSPLPYVARDSW